MKQIFFLLLIALSACSSGEKLAACKGPVLALNPGHWQPTKDDLEASPQTTPPPGRP